MLAPIRLRVLGTTSVSIRGYLKRRHLSLVEVHLKKQLLLHNMARLVHNLNSIQTTLEYSV